MYRYFKRISGVGNGSYIYFSNSKGLSDEKVNSMTTSNHIITPKLSYYVTETRVEFSGSCLKQDEITYEHWKIVNIYIVFEITQNYNISDYSTLENCLFGTVTLTKNADIDKCKYSGYGIGFDRHWFFSHPSGGTGRNLVIFGVDMSSCAKIDNKKKDILILGKGPTQGLEHTLSAEKMYLNNFTENNKNIFLVLQYNGTNSYLFVKEIHKFKAENSETVSTPLCLGNIS